MLVCRPPVLFRVDLSSKRCRTLGAVKATIGHRPELQGSMFLGTRLGGVEKSTSVLTDVLFLYYDFNKFMVLTFIFLA